MKGFSLLELLIVLAIVAVIAAFSFPYFGHLLQNSRSDTQRTQLFHVIQFARSEALTRGLPVSLCKSSDQHACGGEWGQGQIVFIDGRSHEQILSVFQGTAGNAKIYWRAFPRHQDDLRFLSDGSTAAENGSFWYCTPSAIYPAWALMIGKSGRAREVLPDQEGKIRDSRGGLLRCVS